MTSSSTDATDKEEAWEDVVAIFGLPSKEFQRSSRQVRLEDLNAKQLAVCFSNVTANLAASDIMQIGGEVEAGLQIQACSVYFGYSTGAASDEHAS